MRPEDLSDLPSEGLEVFAEWVTESLRDADLDPPIAAFVASLERATAWELRRRDGISSSSSPALEVADLADEHLEIAKRILGRRAASWRTATPAAADVAHRFAGLVDEELVERAARARRERLDDHGVDVEVDDGEWTPDA